MKSPALDLPCHPAVQDIRTHHNTDVVVKRNSGLYLNLPLISEGGKVRVVLGCKADWCLSRMMVTTMARVILMAAMVMMAVGFLEIKIIDGKDD